MRITLVTTLALALAGALVTSASGAVSSPGNSVNAADARADFTLPLQTNVVGTGNMARLTGRTGINDVMWRVVGRSSVVPFSSAVPETVSLAALLAGAWLLSARRRSASQSHWTSDSFDY